MSGGLGDGWGERVDAGERGSAEGHEEKGLEKVELTLEERVAGSRCSRVKTVVGRSTLDQVQHTEAAAEKP